jgi:hypothetical protein
MLGVCSADNPYRAELVKAELGRNCRGDYRSSAKGMKAVFSFPLMRFTNRQFQSRRTDGQAFADARRDAISGCNAPVSKRHLTHYGGRRGQFSTGRPVHFRGFAEGGMDVLNSRMHNDSRFVAAEAVCFEKTMLRRLNGRSRGLNTCR